MEEILRLSTIAPHVTINLETKKHPKGKSYELANRNDLGPFENARLLDAQQAASALLAEQTRGQLPAKKERELNHALGVVVKLIVPSIEDSVLDELSLAQRTTIMLTWVAQVRSGDQGEAGTARKRTTAASRRASKPSTAATRRGGSTSRRGS